MSITRHKEVSNHLYSHDVVWISMHSLLAYIHVCDVFFLFLNFIVVIPAVATSLGLAEGSELVDPQVISGAINYLISNQERSGRFPVLGRLHNYYLLVRSLIGCLVACSGRISVDTQTDNPTTVTLTAHARRGLIILRNFRLSIP